MKDYEIDERVSEMLREARQKACVSQDFVAQKLNVSKKTIQNIENGASYPSMRQIMRWFEAIDIPIYPYLFRFSHPELLALNANSTDEDVRSALLSIIKDMDMTQLRQHFFEMYGEHGTAPQGMGEVKTAYLHLPMYVKVSIADIIATAYEMAEARNELVLPDKIMPDKEALRNYIEKAKKAVIDGKETYL